MKQDWGEMRRMKKLTLYGLRHKESGKVLAFRNGADFTNNHMIELTTDIEFPYWLVPEREIAERVKKSTQGNCSFYNNLCHSFKAMDLQLLEFEVKYKDIILKNVESI